MSGQHLLRIRRGQSLILVFLMLVAIMGILALTLDLGFVILARRQMQTGVNTAALEGLRNVDQDNNGSGDGRESASTLLRNVFDDDLDPTSNNSTVGAGIASNLVQGNGYRQTTLGDASGSRGIYTNRSNFIYRPNPQLNESNAIHGDLVEGVFDRNATSHDEAADYSRIDFDLPAVGATLVDSFLVRLRRTHDPNGLDNSPGTSSAGGGLPLLIGRLAWFSEQGAGAAYSIRRDGVTVRATAIADKRFAVRVWPATTSDQVYGAIPFAITKNDFVTQANLAAFINPTTQTLTRFGQVASFSGVGSYGGEIGYVAIVDNTLGRVIGFYLADTAAVPNRQPNSSARISDAWDVVGELTDAERDSLNTSRQDAADNSDHQFLRSPTLVRSIR